MAHLVSFIHNEIYDDEDHIREIFIRITENLSDLRELKKNKKIRMDEWCIVKLQSDRNTILQIQTREKRLIAKIPIDKDFTSRKLREEIEQWKQLKKIIINI
jgi:hypothetical protein